MNITVFPEKKWTKAAFLQIRRFSKKDYQKYLRKDPKWIEVNSTTFYNEKLPKPHDFISIHYHKGSERFKNSRMIRNMLNQICWTEDVLKEWKAIK